jgi:hypothetical protein
MTVQPVAVRSHDAFGVVQRCVGWAVVVAALICGLIGSAEWPVVGTLLGVVTGSVAGAVVGLANGLTLAALTAVTTSRVGARLVAAVTSLGCAVLTAVVTDASPRWDWMVAVALGTVLAALVGPLAAFGTQPVVQGPCLARWSVRELLTRVLAGGAVVGAALGGLAGLVIGSITYLPTAPFAIVEGGVLGAVSGVLVALLVATAVVGPKLRVRR